jgi:hypothetical protein
VRVGMMVIAFFIITLFARLYVSVDITGRTVLL